MTLEKAIEILREILFRGSMITDKDDDCSIKLGIEALKRITNGRSKGSLITPNKLPSEE